MFHLESLPKPTALFSATKEQMLLDAIEMAKLLVGRLDVTYANGSKSHGSCFFFSNKFQMITCFHVVENAASMEVAFPQLNANVSFPAHLVAQEPRMDLAAIQFDPGSGQTEHNLPYYQFATECMAGKLSFCAGFPSDGNFHVTDGMVTTTDDPGRFVVTNITDHGVSGGPCFGRTFRDLLGVVAHDFGVTHHRTAIIPFVIVKLFCEWYLAPMAS